MSKKSNELSGLFGKDLSQASCLRWGLIGIAVGAGGFVLGLVLESVTFLSAQLPLLTLFVGLIPAVLGALFLSSAAVMALGHRQWIALSVGAGSVVIVAAAGAAVYLPPIGAIAEGIVSFSLSGDAIALTVVCAIIGLGVGLRAHPTVPHRPFILALFFPLVASWPDYFGSYVVLTEGYNPITRMPGSLTERLEPELVLELQYSGQIFVQYAAAAGAGVLAAAVGMGIRRLRRPNR